MFPQFRIVFNTTYIVAIFAQGSREDTCYSSRINLIELLLSLIITIIISSSSISIISLISTYY